MTTRIILSTGFLAFMEEINKFFYDMRWFLVLGTVLLFVDLKFGVTAAKKRGEIVRTSRAIRRTMNKAVDYTCWLILAQSLGMAFDNFIGSHILAPIVLFIIFGVEVNICFYNYFETKNKRFNFNIFRIFSKQFDMVRLDDIEEIKPKENEDDENL